LSETEGEALSTEFGISVSGCEDDLDDFPLYFKFKIQNGHDLAARASSDPSVKRTLSAGKPSWVYFSCVNTQSFIDLIPQCMQ